ncbi:MAG: hypothetical protein WBR26_03255 [Candidatus Acidiferrum sp.]
MDGKLTRMEIWMRGIFAAGISGASGGMMTGLAAVGIDPSHFNLQAGVGATGKITGAAAFINAVIGVAAYLQKSPLPDREKAEDQQGHEESAQR